jgi:hypothetical protein
MGEKSKKKREPLTEKRIRELLEQSAKGAAELDAALRRIFRLPDRPLRLD